jgi:hypothetical protein
MRRFKQKFVLLLAFVFSDNRVCLVPFFQLVLLSKFPTFPTPQTLVVLKFRQIPPTRCTIPLCCPVRIMEKSVFNHLALPQNLPHSEDARLDDVEVWLTDHLLMAVRLMRDSAAGDDLRSETSSVWERLRECLVVSKAVTRDGRVDKMRLLSELRRMTARDAILVDIRSQNAALLIHRVPE